MTVYVAVDFHAREQTISWCDTADGEVHRTKLRHQQVQHQIGIAAIVLLAARKWSQGLPLSLLDGLAGLQAVESKLSRSQLRVRDEAVQKARKFMVRAASSGGAGPVSRTFRNAEVIKRKGNERVDIVVNSGVAFVP